MYDPIRYDPTPEALISSNYGNLIRLNKTYQMPSNHFLLYLRDDGNTLWPRRMWDYGISDIKVSEARLFNLAREGKPDPAYQGPGFANMIWNFPSHMTIVLDNDGLRFNFNGLPTDVDAQPVIFVDKFSGVQYHENYSFFNAIEVEVPILNQQGQEIGKRWGVRFENHSEYENGQPIKKGDPRRYKMNLLVRKPTVGDPLGTLYHVDPDGQNQGPP